MRRRLMTSLSLTAALLIGVTASAAEPAPPGPKARVDAVYAAIADAAATAVDQAALTEVVTVQLEGLVDYTAFARRTLKKTWPTLDAEQRLLFMDRFKKLIVDTYAKRFKPKTAFEVGYRGEPLFRGDTKQRAKVMTTVKSGKVAADVDYFFTRKDEADKADKWFAYDFEIDTVSMALNWRKQFEKIVARDGFDALIAKIESKLDKGDE